MKFKDVAISDASTEAKVAALAVLLDKELLKLAETVLNVQAIEGAKGEQGLQGPKGEQGDRGFDGTNGKDGSDGKDGKDGEAGKQGVGVQDAKIDFDGSLVITLTDGTEINAGEIVPLDTAEKIRVIGNGGGTSQSVLDAIAAIQATIATYGTMATQNANNVAITGGSINGTTVGGTTPAAGTFTALSTGTLTATGQTSLGGAAGSESLRVLVPATAGTFLQVQGTATGAVLRATGDTGTNSSLTAVTRGTLGHIFSTGGATTNSQLQVSHTASAVNYVQVTGAATGNNPQISSQGSDANITLEIASKGNTGISFRANGARQFLTASTASAVNYLQVSGTTAGNAPVLSAQGSDTNIPLVLQPKGTGALQAQQTDSTATGGNARGANAVDWQTSRDSASKVASGQFGVISGGYANIASGSYGIAVGGAFNAASGESSFIGGGSVNSATQAKAVTVGGNSNNSTRDFAAVVGGQSNNATGYFNFIGGGASNTGTANAAVTTQSGTMNGTTAVTLSGSNANIKVGQLITGTSIATWTYVAAVSGTSLTLSQAASGSSTSTLSFFTPHGVVVGGGNNQATGSYSFIGGGGDAGTAGNRNVASGAWSSVLGGFKNTASGLGAVVAGGGTYDGANGGGNTASGIGAFVANGWGNNASNGGTCAIGVGMTVNGQYSTGIGYYGTTRSISGYIAFAANTAPVAANAAQAGLLVLARQTTDATATVLTSESAGPSTTNQVILPNNSAYYFKGSVVAGVTGGGNTKGWTVEGVIKRGANAASTAIVGTATVVSAYGDAGAATWTITALADTTNGGLKITATGQAATTIRWVCKIETTEMTY